MEGSHIATHMMTVHPEEWVTKDQQVAGWLNFKVEIIKTHTSSFIRQLHEAATIMLQPGHILNDMAEYNRCLVPSPEINGYRRGESNKEKQARELRETVREMIQETYDTSREEMAAKRPSGHFDTSNHHNKRHKGDPGPQDPEAASTRTPHKTTAASGALLQ